MIPFPAELNRNQYPALAVLDDLRRHLQSEHRCVLSAPPGAGKTTVLPLALLNEPWRHGKILILEPRRLAALAAAGRMAALLGEPVGRHIGYRMRLATKSSRETLIEVVTDGILVRMLQEDPELKGVSAVVFDEFHERSLQNDLALALTLDAAELREDLRLLVMSATLDAEKTGAFLAAPLVQSAGRQFPVRTIYRAVAQERPLEELVADVVLHALRTETGSLLIFLPGESWIRRCVETLRRHLTDPAIRLYPLYGRLTPEEQQLADGKLLQWHPAFYADLQIEFREETEKLKFEREYLLSSKPMAIDVLIIKKKDAEPIHKNIGKIFRKYNIIEYKSPSDSLSVDDFYKVYGYTNSWIIKRTKTISCIRPLWRS